MTCPNNGRVLVAGSCVCPNGQYDNNIATACQNCPVTCSNCALVPIVNTVGCTACPVGANINRVSSPVNNLCPCLFGYI